MNQDLIPLEPQAVPYVRPHAVKKKKSGARSLLILVLLAVGLIILFRFLPENAREFLNSFFSDGTTEETTTTESTTSQTTTSDTPAPTETTDLYRWECSLPESATAIIPKDLSANTIGKFAENPTDAILEAVRPVFPQKTDGISVLILNTHSFESYAENGALYHEDEDFMSGNSHEKGVKNAANALKNALAEHNIHAVFIDCMTNSALGSYKNAKKLLSLAMEDHPEAVLAIDIHRLTLVDEKGALLRPVTEINGVVAAQVRITVGAGEGFERHAAAALSLHETVMITYPSLMMPLTVSEGSFLQSAEIPVLTLEIGSVGNSMEEASCAAEYLAAVIAEKMEK